ncbi:uncharacterized protein LOC105628704 isoform X1 [Jatropha curcas]|uniref:uncharacterized protein LOC105628704 isoform X1 n=1 Tax=Jatropha curcas TaxID=180498 RepID=UPI0005FB234A|nr:uncharacterized protein LOC105628704 isoform X1 [Jatropha curcas]
MAVIAEEPILSRLGRVDNMLRQLEEIRGSSNRSPKSSIASTPSSGTLTSEGQVSSIDFSPKCLEKHCRPINRVMTETEIKGTLIERLDQAEERLLKLCIQLEEELVTERKEEQKKIEKKEKKGLKGFVKKVVKGGQKKIKTKE